MTRVAPDKTFDQRVEEMEKLSRRFGRFSKDALSAQLALIHKSKLFFACEEETEISLKTLDNFYRTLKRLKGATKTK